MELSEEAKEFLAKEVAELTQKNVDMLRELKIYQWALRLVFTLVFGGTVLGILKLQDYLDDRIQKRSEELSGIVYGSTAQSSGDPRTAIEQYSEFLTKLDDSVLRPSEPIRSIYFYRFLQALADDNQLDPTGEFEVKTAFNSLVESKYFKKDFLRNEQRWRTDQSYLNAWGRCLLKFGTSVEAIEAARSAFQRAAEVAIRPSDVAANNFGMAMIALIQSREEDAKYLFRTASQSSPKSHGLNNFTGKYKNDLEDEFQIWERGAKLLKKNDIADVYERVFSTLIQDQKKTKGPMAVR